MKQKLFLLSIILPVLGSCQQSASSTPGEPKSASAKSVLTRVSDIPVPEGFSRRNAGDSSFTRWLRNIALKKDNTVYLYNGQRKTNQAAQFAVLDVPVGHRDLQQCADAVMRLRAAWLYDEGRYSGIRFSDNNGRMYVCPPAPDSAAFERYLQTVFSYCGTLSLSHQLSRQSWNDLQPGDVLIRGGSPGHAVIVIDVVVDTYGNKRYMLAQSYMPAQNIHILKNPSDPAGGPWYDTHPSNNLISTPEWNFYSNELKTW